MKQVDLVYQLFLNSIVALSPTAIILKGKKKKSNFRVCSSWLDFASARVICPGCRAGDATASLITHTQFEWPRTTAGGKSLIPIV